MKLSTYKKYILLTTISSCFFLLLFLGLYYYTIRLEKNDYNITTTNFKKEINALLESNWSSYKNQINDMSFWDEFVTYIHTKDKKWFDFYVGTSIDVYELDLVSVYDLNGNLIDSRARGKYEQDIIPKEVFQELYKKKYFSFFIKNNNVFYKIYAATIHPSNDPTKTKSSPKGYFFMGLRLDNNYFNKIRKISSATKCSITNSEITSNKHTIHFSKNLYDWEGKGIGKFQFEKNYTKDFSVSKIVLQIILLFGLLYLIVTIYFSKKWIFKPLKTITKILESNNNSNEINELKKVQGEFGHIGNLFEENNNQKINLINAKQEAEKSNNLKSVFLANLSHEIRTPINAINGFSELLLHSKTNAEEKKEYLNIVNQSGKNLVNIIDDLIEMSKIDSNLVQPTFRSFNLEKAIQELYESIKITIPNDKDLEFHLIPPLYSHTENVITDETKLKQIITNLVNNAVKFTEKGKVLLSYDINVENKTLNFIVSDTGIGITNENLDKIFERFGRIESDLSIKVGGLGLGLSITKAYVELLKGKIEISSDVGLGTSFKVEIPFKPEENPQIISTEIDKNPVKINSKGTILIAEDDNINFLLFQKIIRGTNFEIIRAINGEEAIEICFSNPNINLILMDIKMPICSGYDAIAKIRPAFPNLIIIAQTAYAADEDKFKILNSGFNDYISKPLDRIKLLNLIKKYLTE